MIRKRTDESEYAEKVWIHNIMKLKVNGFTFVLAFCLLIIFCVHVWKTTSPYSINANGKVETAPS